MITPSIMSITKSCADASRGGCKQKNWQSSEQDAAVQRNHRVEGFLCVSDITHTRTCTAQNPTHTHTPPYYACCVENLGTIAGLHNHFAAKSQSNKPLNPPLL